MTTAEDTPKAWVLNTLLTPSSSLPAQFERRGLLTLYTLSSGTHGYGTTRCWLLWTRSTPRSLEHRRSLPFTVLSALVGHREATIPDEVYGAGFENTM